MSALTLSVLLSLVSAAAYAAAAIVQERVAVTGEPGTRMLLRRGSWWVSVMLNSAGALLHVWALGLGPLTVVQPLGVLTLVFVLPMAALTVRRRATAAGWRGALMVSSGLAGILLLTGPGGSRPLGGSDQLMVAVVTLGTIVTLVAAAVGLHRPVPRSLALATAAGVSFGAASVFTKTVAEGWSPATIAGDLPAMGMIAVLAVTGLLASQASYRGAGLATPLATVTMVNPMLAAVIGITLLGEGFRYGPTGAVLAAAAAAFAAWGLVVLTGDSAARQQSTPQTAPASRGVPGARGTAGHPARRTAAAEGPGTHRITEPVTALAATVPDAPCPVLPRGRVPRQPCPPERTAPPKPLGCR
jgi:hypothetical protein